ncbi:hypothetical protein Rumeso_02286 [Rubellimicrobium mesophilum DSM 19309]|uniref:Uncharacterized protein n=1 Tax=Rubellimicrobium mesophilum DSM 19309 TaxID=442562 RepID=A0A017HNQ4_9RHOB|nr:hypothetical protein Rumeso_02286 [Rubellimicrobium mesophilum DSM 19309]
MPQARRPHGNARLRPSGRDGRLGPPTATPGPAASDVAPSRSRWVARPRGSERPFRPRRRPASARPLAPLARPQAEAPIAPDASS